MRSGGRRRAASRKSNSSASAEWTRSVAASRAALAEARHQVAVDLDHVQRARAPRAAAREGAAPGPISTMRSPGCGAIARTIRSMVAGIVQEVLAEALAGAASPLRAAAHERAASRSAASRLPASARPVPARSSAVPWSTEVRTIGSPSVTLTAWPKPACLSTGSPWSWYMASTASTPASCSRQEQRVGRQRADELRARAAQPREHRLDHLDLLAAEVAAFAGVRVEAAHQDARRRDRRTCAAGRRRGCAARDRSARGVMAARHLCERQVGRRERHAQRRRRPASSPAAQRRSARRGTRCGR